MAIPLLFLLACGSGTSQAPSSESSVTQDGIKPISKELQSTVNASPIPNEMNVTPERVSEINPTESPVPTATPTPEPTVTMVPIPTATATPKPTPTVAPQEYVASNSPNILNQFGFSISLEEDVDFAQFDLKVSGVSLSHADSRQGLITFEYKAVDVAVIWLPGQGQSSEEVIASAYFLLQSAQPNNSFTVINSGPVSVGQIEGYFSGFLITNISGVSLGGGLIGSWVCGNRDFTIIVTGDDPTALQIRFDRLLSGFSCSEGR